MDTTAPALRFATLAAPRFRSLAGLSVDVAESRLERQLAREFHRDVYRRKRLLPEDAFRMPGLPEACTPGSAIFVAKECGAIVGTITFYMDSAIGLPIDDVHGDEVNDKRRRHTCIAEAGALAVLEDRRCLGISMKLYEATLRWAVARGVECIVACVNPSSRRVYSKLLLFEVLGACKPHPRFMGAPSIPIALDLCTAPSRFKEVHGFELERYMKLGQDGEGAVFAC